MRFLIVTAKESKRRFSRKLVHHRRLRLLQLSKNFRNSQTTIGKHQFRSQESYRITRITSSRNRMRISITPSQATHQALDTSQGCKRKVLVTYLIWRLQHLLIEKWKIKSTIQWPFSFWIGITSRSLATQVSLALRGGSKSAAKVMSPPILLHLVLLKQNLMLLIQFQYTQRPLCPTLGLSFQRGRNRTPTNLNVEFPPTMTHIKREVDWLRKVSQANPISQEHLSWPKEFFQEHSNGVSALRAHMLLSMSRLSKTLTEIKVKRMMKQRKLTQSHHS